MDNAKYVFACVSTQYAGINMRFVSIQQNIRMKMLVFH